jgi:hypothetical protein
METTLGICCFVGIVNPVGSGLGGWVEMELTGWMDPSIGPSCVCLDCLIQLPATQPSEVLAKSRAFVITPTLKFIFFYVNNLLTTIIERF